MPASIRPKDIATPEDMMRKFWCQPSPKIHVTAWATYLKKAKPHVPTGDEFIDQIQGGTGAPGFDLNGYITYQAHKDVSFIEVVWCRKHITKKISPAVAAVISSDIWCLERLLMVAAAA